MPARESHEQHQDAGKTMWELIPLDAVDWIAKVLTYGANKYTPQGWKTLPDATERYFGSLMRHLKAWRGGELIDPESNLPHLAHAGCNMLFLIWFNLCQKHDI